MDEFMMGLIYLEGINLLLSAALLWVFAQNYRVLKTTPGMGLVLFSAVLFIQNLIGVYLHYTTGEFYAKMLATHAFGLEAVEMIALAVLTYSAWKD